MSIDNEKIANLPGGLASVVNKHKIGDQVTLIGLAGVEKVTADDLAELAQTTNYEIVTRLNPLMKRVFLTKPQTKRR